VIINKDEELLLSDDAYQQKIAQSLADGIVAYLKNSKKCKLKEGVKWIQ
jgi:N-acetylmuramoyl-L-alanine amidase